MTAEPHAEPPLDEALRVTAGVAPIRVRYLDPQRQTSESLHQPSKALDSDQERR
jgi:hypothetical protein